MSYYIVYGDESPQKTEKHPLRRMIMTACFLGIFLWCVCRFWAAGKEVLQSFFIPGDPDRTIEAAQVFAQELSCGFSFADAAANFRETLLNHGFSD